MDPGPIALTSPGNKLEIQVLAVFKRYLHLRVHCSITYNK